MLLIKLHRCILSPSIQEHPGTAKNVVAETFFNRSYTDFSANQTGHGTGVLMLRYGNTISWNLSFYNRTQNKPVINIEAFYDNVDSFFLLQRGIIIL